jgi:hypothetical protein
MSCTGLVDISIKGSYSYEELISYAKIFANLHLVLGDLLLMHILTMWQQGARALTIQGTDIHCFSGTGYCLLLR